jgi:hemoglobin-like flavoprotein
MAMTTEQLVDTFECSLTRCLDAGDFTGAFYGRLIAASDVVSQKFSNTDIERHKDVLKQSLYLMAKACMGREEGLDHLESVARTHSHHRLDISPSLYRLWLDTLIDTAREYDSHFDDEVESSWRQLLQKGIDRMIEVYRTETTVRPTR